MVNQMDISKYGSGGVLYGQPTVQFKRLRRKLLKPEVLAIVQARGGSKGIPGKNIRRFAGIPLIAYSIASGQAASTVTRLIVSTDDAEIAAVARAYGAEVPFMRPAELATDNAMDFSLFYHAVRWLKQHEDYTPDVVVQLRPTSPLRPKGLVNQAVHQLLTDPRADSVRTVAPSRQNPYKMWRLQEGCLTPLLDTTLTEPYNMPRQKLPATYWQTGHLDVMRCHTIVEKKSMTGDIVLPVFVEPQYCIDIDTLQDWERGEWILEHEDLEIDLPFSTDGDGRVNQLPKSPKMVVLDFDGVLTDNRVWVSESGDEAVLCNRGDGMGLSMLRKRGIGVFVLSSEENPVVRARCQKLGISCQHGIEEKMITLRQLANQHQIPFEDIVYVGNDLNDLACMQLVGCGVAVADAHPTILDAADYTLSREGGRGAVRELCDLILADKRE